MMHDTTDVFVIGGGPAGLAAALAARQRGLQVTVADSCTPPIDKPCGEGLMPDSVAALRRLGVNLPMHEAYRFRGIRFLGGALSSEAEFPEAFGIGLRRTILHRVMVEHAERAGVQMMWNAVVTGLNDRGVLVRNQLFPARWIVAADGGSSQTRRWAGLELHRKKDQRYTFRQHYKIAPWSDFVELHWGPNCQIYITPIAVNRVCVALISRNSALRLEDALPYFPAIAERLRGVDVASVERGAVSVTRKLARVCTDRVALIGDASGGVDAITGEGLCLAFQHATRLAECLASGSLARYPEAHRSVALRPAMMARMLLLLENRETLRQRVLRTFVKDPRVFTRLLATHVGEGSHLDFAASGLALGWKLLTV